jgi:hypothetical protein
MKTLTELSVKRWLISCAAAVLVLLLAPAPTTAQVDHPIGGHFGFVIPFATFNDDNTVTNINEDFAIGFPMGITVKKFGRLAFDLEFVPNINDHEVNLTVHPGLLYDLGYSFTGGVRMAFDVRQDSWGFTPLLARKLWDINESAFMFLELDVPIRIQEDNTATTLALHLGIGF